MRFQGSVFRTLDPRWAWDPLSGEGASKYGGRFNPIGVPTLYTSLTYEGATRERIGLARTQPVITCQYQVDIEPIFNGLDTRDLGAFQIEEKDFDGPWEGDISRGLIPKSHVIALRLKEAGYAIGLLVKSFAFAATSDDINLVLWNYGDELPRKIEVIDDERVLGRIRQIYEE